MAADLDLLEKLALAPDFAARRSVLDAALVAGSDEHYWRSIQLLLTERPAGWAAAAEKLLKSWRDRDKRQVILVISLSLFCFASNFSVHICRLVPPPP